jgi:flagellar biosynthesis anti-sigma factor FlgM
MKGITGNISDAYQRYAVKPLGSTQQSQATGATQSSTRSGSAEAAKVTISAQARELANGGGVNTQKIEALKAAIADGSFKVNSTFVAERILDGFGA